MHQSPPWQTEESSWYAAMDQDGKALLRIIKVILHSFKQACHQEDELMPIKTMFYTFKQDSNMPIQRYYELFLAQVTLMGTVHLMEVKGCHSWIMDVRMTRRIKKPTAGRKSSALIASLKDTMQINATNQATTKSRKKEKKIKVCLPVLPVLVPQNKALITLPSHLLRIMMESQGHGSCWIINQLWICSVILTYWPTSRNLTPALRWAIMLFHMWLGGLGTWKDTELSGMTYGNCKYTESEMSDPSKQAFMVTKLNGIVFMFRESPSGLHYLDTECETRMTLLNTVANNWSNYINED